MPVCTFDRIIPNVAALKIKREKISKQDVAFMKKVKVNSMKEVLRNFLLTLCVCV